MGLPVASAEASAHGGEVKLDQIDGQRLYIDLSESSKIWKEAALLYAACFYAGWQAELLLHSYSLTGYVSLGDVDHQHAADVLRNSFGDHLPIFEAQKLARAILRRYWPDVENLAMQLYKMEYLTRPEIEPFIPSSLPSHDELLGMVPSIKRW